MEQTALAMTSSTLSVISSFPNGGVMSQTYDGLVLANIEGMNAEFIHKKTWGHPLEAPCQQGNKVPSQILFAHVPGVTSPS